MSLEHGEVESPVGTLKCTPRAWKELGAYFGDFIEAFRKLAAFNPDAYVAIVAAGLNKPRKEVENTVYEAGMPTLTESLSDYIGLLSNGGRPVERDDTGKPKTGEA